MDLREDDQHVRRMVQLDEELLAKLRSKLSKEDCDHVASTLETGLEGKMREITMADSSVIIEVSSLPGPQGHQRVIKRCFEKRKLFDDLHAIRVVENSRLIRHFCPEA